MTRASPARRRRRRLLVSLALVLALGALAWPWIDRHVRAARILAGVGAGDPVEGVRERDLTLAGLPARRYATGGGPPVLLVHGVHPAGIDEPRLVRFARLLADAGFVVVTPALPALRELRFDAASADRIGRTAGALAQLEGADAVGIVGISFGGGLALVAAADPAHRDAIAAVWAIGPHHDARRLCRWWRGEAIAGPDGERPAVTPERYGAQVLAYAYAEDYFDDQVPRARRALRAALDGDGARTDRLAAELAPPVRAQLARIRHGGDLDAAAPRLAEVAEAHAAELAAVSPAGRLADARAEVFLLHGRDDPVVAATESRWIAAELPAEARGGLVVTDLIRHAETHALADLSTQWAVIHLVAGALGALDR
ncbi:MAG TPA: hypothetical protein RMH99_08145 [Sandaracinaceae bacterium LLY-WYZ-13_1]|nr:hypothetical protein [Sandaracinaceae bacterium LLY-WYZ-13_1]